MITVCHLIAWCVPFRYVVGVSSSITFRPLKTSPPLCLETSGTARPVTRRYVPEWRKPQLYRWNCLTALLANYCNIWHLKFCPQRLYVSCTIETMNSDYFCEQHETVFVCSGDGFSTLCDVNVRFLYNFCQFQSAIWFSMPLSFRRCSILFLIFMLLLSEGQVEEGWEPSGKAALSWMSRILTFRRLMSTIVDVPHR